MSLLINKQFKFNDSQISVFGTTDKLYFIANDVAILLGYKYPKDSIRDNVWRENKIKVEEYEKENNCITSIVKKTTMLINVLTIQQQPKKQITT